MMALHQREGARRLIIVTGAPRSATSPVGSMLATAQATAQLYEPMGPTGAREIPARFAMPGEAGFSVEQATAFLEIMGRLEYLLKPQGRAAYQNLGIMARLARQITGSQSRTTLLAAKLRPRLKNVICKDPHAAFLAPLAASKGVDVVICLRSPEAHAASFKRLSWRPIAAEVYDRYRALHGPLAGIEALQRHRELSARPVIAATQLWHVINHTLYHALIGPNAARFHLVSSRALEMDESQVYRKVFERLDLTPSAKTKSQMKSREAAQMNTKVSADKVHDFHRSMKTVNNYWTELLDPEEIEIIQELNAELYGKLDALAL